ncbi:hypothetical protein JCM11251_002420 [Rhodosporidiobolus azoricus]
MARPRSPGPSPAPSSRLTSRHAALALLASLAVLPTTVSAQSSSLPRIDFSAMGTVAVVGSFAGLSLYDAENPPVAYDSAASTLIGRTSEGESRNLGNTDEGGSIAAICQLEDGKVFLGGNFTAVGGVESANIAHFDPAGKTFSPLGDGLEGEVRALACNGTTVYAGGDFAAPSGVDGAGPNVAAWSTSSGSWSALPFYGFNGAVESIFQAEDGRSLFFGGAFSTTFSNSSTNSTSSTSSTSSGNPSSSPQIPSLGSSLAPISLNTSDYWASPTTYTSGFGRPQYIFCPRHEDGVGASWMLVDGIDGFFIARMYRELNVRGIRLGNMFYEGRGTKDFSVVALPNNEVLELTYNSDPSDPTSPLLTCTSSCPLAHNSSLPYQDFLFPPGTTLTGIQLNVLGWYGASGGLHLMQLLSDGSYAYAVESQNTSPCTSGLGASTQASVDATGEWTTESVTTSTAGTTQDVLVASIRGGTEPADAPSVTWQPYVQQDGEYAVYLVTPGCTAEGTCSRRTTVSVTATPNGGTAKTTTVDQAVSGETSTLIYNGTLSAGADSLSVRLTLADGGAPEQGRRYELVANYINLVAASTRGESTRLDQAYGLFEYPLVDSGSFGDGVSFSSRPDGEGVNATGVLTNATGMEQMVAMRFERGARVDAVVATGQGEETQLFVGGNFTWSSPSSSSSSSSSSANIVSYRLNSPFPAPNGGLNGPVSSLVVLQGALFAAGSFDATADGSVTELGGIAKWNYSSSATSWEKLGGEVPSTFGEAGSIAQLAVLPPSSPNDKDASSTLAAIGAGGSGYAVFSPSSSSWNSTAGGFFLGNLSAISTPISSTTTDSDGNATTYLAGNVAAAVRNAAPGGAVLGSGKGGQPRLTSFGFGFNSSSPSSSSSSSSSSTGSPVKRSPAAEDGTSTSAASSTPPLLLSPRGMSRVILEPRAPQSSSAVNLILPSPIQAVAASASAGEDATNQVLTGAFWKNGSMEWMIFGGSFRTENASNLALYNPADGSSLVALPGQQGGEIEGAVTALLVVQDEVWVGGNFSTADGERQGLVMVDLKEGDEGVQTSLPGLSGYSGTNATVSAIAQRPGYDEQILVAGAFSQAGSLWCQSVCLWDSKASQWSNLGTGLQGAVGSIDFAGSKSEYLLAAGNFVLDSDTRYVARWNFKNSSWSGLGAANDLPGPATAVSSDNNDKDKVFVAGQSTAGSPYLFYWNGTVWSDVNNSTLANGSGVQSLAFVPLQSNHDSNSVIESNRMLMVSGDLTINDTSVASALYDGESWYPYLLATSATGSAGIVSQLFFSITDFSLSGRSHLSPGIVILISIAIALGVVFLLVLIGLLIALARRKDEPQSQYPPPAAMHDGTGTETSSLHRPTSLLQTVGAATAVLLDPKGEKGVPQGGAHGYPYEGDAGLGSFDAAAAGGVGAGAMSYGSDYDDDEDAQPSTALARYSFHAEHPGELTISGNENLQVLESSDPNWWMVANTSGQRGLVPVSYLC